MFLHKTRPRSAILGLVFFIGLELSKTVVISAYSRFLNTLKRKSSYMYVK